MDALPSWLQVVDVWPVTRFTADDDGPVQWTDRHVRVVGDGRGGWVVVEWPDQRLFAADG